MTLEELKMLADMNELKGLFEGISDEIYHNKNCPGRSSTYLKKMLAPSTPAHALASLDDKEDSDERMIGRAVHAAILEPEKFTAQFAFVPEGMRRDERSEAYREFLVQTKGKQILKSADYQSVLSIRDEFFKHPLSKFVTGKIEHSGFWTDPETGILCKVRPDCMTEDGLVFDLKTTKDCGEYEFSKSIHKFGYHISAAMYLEGLSRITGYKLDKFVLVAIEKKAPYGIIFYDLNKSDLEQGLDDFRQALKLEKECREKNFWPGYPTTFQTIGLPAFARRASI